MSMFDDRERGTSVPLSLFFFLFIELFVFMKSKL